MFYVRGWLYFAVNSTEVQIHEHKNLLKRGVGCSFAITSSRGRAGHLSSQVGPTYNMSVGFTNTQTGNVIIRMSQYLTL